MTCARYTESDSGRIKVVTSATRPTGASRYIGQHIYETDTDRRLYFDGTGWVVMSEPSRSYAPSLAGVTVGTGGIVDGYYHRSDGFVDFNAYVYLGSSGFSVASAPVIGLPFAYSSGREFEVLTCLLYDNSTGGRYQAWVNANSTTTVAITCINTAGSYAIYAAITSTTPFTWAANDAIVLAGRYRMGSRYS